ncbi:MAG: alpha/beta hydrolase [Candidatus Limivivens sp.]|nr:alpha/beta hydrolase [Candidatus Limivivens sp.]
MKVSKILKYAAVAAGTATAVTTGLFFQDVVCRKKSGKGPLWDDEADGLEKYRDQIAEGKEWLKEMEPESEYVMIRSFDGLMLEARFIPAEEKTGKTVLAVHGYTATGEKDYAVMAGFFHEAGYNVLLVDNRAHGSSEGKYVGFGCLDREDCYRWIHYLNRRFHGNCEIFLHGISMGAATVLMTSELNLPPSVKGIVADCGYTTPRAQFEEIAKGTKKAGPFGKLIVACMDVVCRLVAGYGLTDCSSREAVARTKIPVFIIHGDADKTVSVDMAREIYKACASEKRLWIVEGAGHAESFYFAQEEYKKRVLNFFEECLGERKA